MPGLGQNKIVGAELDIRKHTVRLRWANGSRTVLDLKWLTQMPLHAIPHNADYSDTVYPGQEGRVLHWNGKIIAADVIWFRSHPYDAPANWRPRAQQHRFGD
jgi:hypothetical protein